MDAFAVFGFAGFLMVLFLWSKVTRLERILRETGIRPAAAKDLGRQLGQWVGREVTLSLYGTDGETQGQPCRVLDADEEWALLLCEEGKKKERQVLIRLDDVKQVRLAGLRRRKGTQEEETA